MKSPEEMRAIDVHKLITEFKTNANLINITATKYQKILNHMNSFFQKALKISLENFDKKFINPIGRPAGTHLT
jgi:uncharacterized membrane-anchored protein YhcB (DUF1043 family)